MVQKPRLIAGRLQLASSMRDATEAGRQGEKDTAFLVASFGQKKTLDVARAGAHTGDRHLPGSTMDTGLKEQMELRH